MPLSSAKGESVNLIVIIVTIIREQSENEIKISKSFISNML